MTAIILAAGRGGRLRPIMGDRPKCLATLGGGTLLERQIRLLHGAGVAEVAVVAGFRAADVQRVCGSGVRIVVNREYAATNSLYSMWLARDVIADGCVVLNSDVLFHPQLLDDLLQARYEDALLMCARGAGGDFSSEEMKIHTRRGLVVAIDKALRAEEADGENVGIAKFGRDGAALLIREMDRIVGAGALREWLPRAFDAFCRLRPLRVVETRGYPWIEIDFPEDYWRARSDILPAIEQARQRAAESVFPADTAPATRGVVHHV
jgi:choline kinase